MPISNQKKHFTVLVTGLWVVFVVLILGISSIFYMIWADSFGWFGKMPSFEQFENPEIEHASELISSDGQLIGKYYRKNRTLCSYEDLSESLKQTLLAAEDRRFFEHSGIDMRGWLRAVLGTLTFNYQGGGSTITMQLAENLYRTSTENKGSLYKNKKLGRIITKFKEWVIAIELEKNFTKEEIMAMYLNTIPFGSSTFGINAAAKTFFDKSPVEINYLEAALLVGLINAPTRYSPIFNPENSIKKRNDVLHKLFTHHHITAATYDSLCKLPIRLNYEVDSHDRGAATYFRAIVRGFMIKWAEVNGYDLFGDGLRIHVTLNSRMQKHAEQSVQTHMKALQRQFEEHWQNQNPWINEKGEEVKDFLKHVVQQTEIYKYLAKTYNENDSTQKQMLWQALRTPKKMRIFSWEGAKDTLFSFMDSLAYYKRFLHAGFMAMEPNTGKIRAWVGGINYKYFKFDHVIQGKRQPGSTIKPFVYAAVIDNGYSPCHEVVDQPVTFYLPDQDPSIWVPSNAAGPPSGKRMTIRQAMARSVNSITAQWIQKIGIENVINYAQRIGITSPLDPVPALCLGAGGDVSVYEMNSAYSTFVNKGIWTEPIFVERIEDKEGNILQEFIPRQVEALSEETAYIMLHMLKGTVEEQGGTAQGIPQELKKENEIGAKTGTTQNASDGWFFGVTQDLVAGGWVGGDNRSIHFRNWVLGQGARTAMPIWISFMRKVYKDSTLNIQKKPFVKPSRPLSISLDCATCTQEKDSIEQQDKVPIEDIF